MYEKEKMQNFYPYTMPRFNDSKHKKFMEIRRRVKMWDDFCYISIIIFSSFVVRTIVPFLNNRLFNTPLAIYTVLLYITRSLIQYVHNLQQLYN